jgi:hypothetical protein
MLAPFAALVAHTSDVEYWALERAAKALRLDPARYQSVEGVEYDLTEPSLFSWEIRFEAGRHVQGLVGLFPLEQLIPHEGTTAALQTRPRHSVQIRPVTALVEEPLPDLEPIGGSVHFHGNHHHIVTPVDAASFTPQRALIADGHHRVAAAMRDGGDTRIMTMVVSTDGIELDAGAFHRVFAAEVDLPESIPGCEIVQEPTLDSIHAGRIAVVTRRGSIGVTVVDRDIPGFLSGLPAGLASRFVLPSLGLDEGDATYADEIRHALTAVDEGGTAVILPHSEIPAIMQAVAAGVTLPPKSTRFRPKPIRGLLMRPFAI